MQKMDVTEKDLLVAAYQLLHPQTVSPYVIDVLGQTIVLGEQSVSGGQYVEILGKYLKQEKICTKK